MQITFRIECPHCHWGHKFKDSYINMGFIENSCDHCGKILFFKVTVTGVQIEVLKEIPKDTPYESLLTTDPKIPLLLPEVTFEEVIQLISAKLGCRLERVTPNARILEDLEADSLDTVEMIMAAEDLFNIEISDEDAQYIRTVNDAYNLILKKVSKQS